MDKKTRETATFAGGCFWCTEAIFKDLKGVETVTSGYAGGEKENPTYEEVSTGDSGFAESIQIEFNPEVISYKELVDIFFRIHDPTTLNRQGSDVGPQYRSAIFYNNEDQKKIAEEVMKNIESEKLYENSIVTQIEALKKFYKAEDYHQDYFENNKSKPYCMLVIDPKVRKFRKEFADKLKN